MIPPPGRHFFPLRFLPACGRAYKPVCPYRSIQLCVVPFQIPTHSRSSATMGSQYSASTLSGGIIRGKPLPLTKGGFLPLEHSFRGRSLPLIWTFWVLSEGPFSALFLIYAMGGRKPFIA